MDINIMIENAVRAAEGGTPAVVTVARNNFGYVSREISKRLLAKNLNPDVVLYNVRK